MKRLVATILLFIFSVVISCSSVGWEKSILLKTEENFISCIENERINFKKADKAISEWNRDKKTLYFFTEQDDFSELENKITAFKISYDLLVCSEIVVILEELRKNSDISLETLL